MGSYNRACTECTIFSPSVEPKIAKESPANARNSTRMEDVSSTAACPRGQEQEREKQRLQKRKETGGRNGGEITTQHELLSTLGGCFGCGDVWNPFRSRSHPQRTATLDKLRPIDGSLSPAVELSFADTGLGAMGVLGWRRRKAAVAG